MKRITFSALFLLAIFQFSCDTNKTEIGDEENNIGRGDDRTPNTHYNDVEDGDTTINMSSGGGTGVGQYPADSLVNNDKLGVE